LRSVKDASREDRVLKEKGFGWRMTMDADNKKREDICPGKKKSLDLTAVREEIAETRGPEYWRSLEELAGSEEFREMMHREFPKGSSEWLDSVSRRGFLQLMGASMALAGMTACTRQPLEQIVPYVKQPDDLVPGRPQFYASATMLGGYASPVLVESHMGRPTKIEGNPEHPASLGASDIFAQASVLEMYDPDRSQTPGSLGQTRSWKKFIEEIRTPLAGQKAVGGEGLRLLTPPVSSPTLADQIHALLRMYPKAKWHQYSPLHRDNSLAGSMLAFGQAVETQYRLENADVILSLDADFLSPAFPGSTRYTHDYAARRNPDAAMNRLYVVESVPSPTGVKAEHRLSLRASGVEGFAQSLASNLGLGGNVLGGNVEDSHFLRAVTNDLKTHAGSCVVMAGEQQSPEVHALAHAINAHLGNVGKTVIHTDTVHANAVDQTASLRELTQDLRDKKVEVLVILGANPVYDAPADLNFADALMSSGAGLRIHHGLHQDETAELCQWHINAAHALEAWSDGRTYDGSVCLVQPLIAPLYDGKSAHEMLAALLGQSTVTGYEIVRAYWQQQAKGADFEAWWRKAVHDGFVAGTEFPAKAVSAKSSVPSAKSVPMDAAMVEVNFRGDPSVYDGSQGNNGWLQELPKPMTKMTWDNPAWIGPAMASRLKLKSEDMITLEADGRKIQVPVWIQAGHPDNAITVFLGYGRRRVGRVGNGTGFNLYEVRSSGAPWRTAGKITPVAGQTYKLASTQGYQTIETSFETSPGVMGTRPVIREGTLAEYKSHPNFAQEMEETPERNVTLYPNVDYSDPNYNKLGYAWGMTVDLGACVGCNACMIACHSENNVAVVGKEQVVVGRHMHWIRVDAYYQGDRDNPSAHFQPVPCMQCENAPCELVCPVGATVHSSEGLNDMVYNRCIGTRYCSNNCPYKVRRFNFLLFQDWETPQFKMMRNPDVSIRSRGVMEKCTYCVQRITVARIDSEREERPVRDGEIQTACQQACPSNAIVFGNINDPQSKVSKLKAQARNYGMLSELNTRPRTTYLAEVRNPNTELEPQHAEHS
jgi:MoCo/4Fe-4S cofactor protein with predicted Tat translocation signal